MSIPDVYKRQEPEMLKHWEELDLYHELLKKNEGKPRFALHDGPPFSNLSLIHICGELHRRPHRKTHHRSAGCLLRVPGRCGILYQ